MSAARARLVEPVPANDQGPVLSVRSAAPASSGVGAKAVAHDQPGSIMRRESQPPEHGAAHPQAPARTADSMIVAFLQTLLNAAKANDTQAPLAAQAAPTFLTVAEFAERLHVGEKTVRRMVSDGMPHERPRPRLIRIPLAKAEAWIAAQTDKASIAHAQERATVDARRGDAH